MEKVRLPQVILEVNASNPDGHDVHNPNYIEKIFRSGRKGKEEEEDMKKKAKCGRICLKILYIVLGLNTILLSIAMITATVATGFATRIYSSDMSGRLVAMIILAVTAAITLCITIYSSIAIFRKKSRPVHVASATLVIIAIIQAVICGVSVRVTLEDEINLSRSLTESFHLAKEDSPRHLKIWATTQSDLSCCGVYGPEDYRGPRLPSYFSPDVPISCCPSYDPNRSELVQERSREVCKSKREFYSIGCKNLVIECFRVTASIVLAISITLMIFEILQAILGSFISRKQDSKNGEANLKGPEDGAPEKPRRHKEDVDQTKSKIKSSDDAAEMSKTKTANATKSSSRP